jgi:hypothetical protein
MIDRRAFGQKMLCLAAAGIWQIDGLASDATRSYHSSTLSLDMEQGDAGQTLFYLTEHGDADYVLIEAFYWYSGDKRVGKIMMHRDTYAPLIKETAVGTGILLDMKDIVFLRVREMKMLKESQFGQVPR